MKCTATLLACLLTGSAYATNTAPPSAGPPVSVDIVNGSRSDSESTAISAASSDATATATQTQTATGTASASVDGNNASQSLSVNYQRQAPSTAQGSLMIGACGAGGNAGGSNSNGSAFLGIAYTPADCKLLLAASAYQALGMYDSACEMVNGISAVKARWKSLGRTAPSCEVKPPVPVVQRETPPVSVTVQPATVDLSAYALKTEVAESQKRQTERLTTK